MKKSHVIILTRIVLCRHIGWTKNIQVVGNTNLHIYTKESISEITSTIHFSFMKSPSNT